MAFNDEVIAPTVVVGIIVLVFASIVGGALVRHSMGLCSCNQPEVEATTVSFVESIETDRPNFLPLTDTEIQRAEVEKIEKAMEKRKKAIEKKRRNHKHKYGTFSCEVCCSDHMECKYCNAKMTLTAQQKRELDNRERAYKERDRRRGRRR